MKAEEEENSSLESQLDDNSIVPIEKYISEREHISNLALNKYESNKDGTILGRALTRTSTIINDIKQDNEIAKEKERDNNGPIEVPESNLGSEEDEKKPSADGMYNQHDMVNKPPDGGLWAWVTCVCVMFINAFSWGANSAFGIYLNYYITTDYFPGATMEDYVTIGGLLLGLSFMICTLSNTLIQRWNFRIVMLVGTAVIFVGFWLASIAKTIVQLVIFQGLFLSIGYGLAAGACFIIIPMWFLKRRSVAQGIAAAGAGLGGIVFSRPVQLIIEKHGSNGVKWALRMQALVCGFMLVISIFLMKVCRPLKDPKLGTKEKPLWKEITAFLFRWDLYKKVPMVCLIIWNMIYGISYTILLFSFSSYATAVGLTYSQGSNVTTVQSVAQLVGRPLLGLFSDRIGRINATIICTVVLSILVIAWWIFIKSYAELIVFGFIAGFIMGINWVNFGPMTADYCGGGSKDALHAMSMLTFSGGMPLIVSELIGLKLRRLDMSKPFLYCQILVAAAGIVSAIALLPFREWKVKRVLKAQKEINPEREGLDILLDDSWKGYLLRMFYPICV